MEIITGKKGLLAQWLTPRPGEGALETGVCVFGLMQNQMFHSFVFLPQGPTTKKLSSLHIW